MEQLIADYVAERTRRGHFVKNTARDVTYILLDFAQPAAGAGI